MDEQLNFAPCGYFVLNADWEIIEMNQTLKSLFNIEQIPKYLHDLLTVPSRIYFETYFLPAMTVHGQVREMYLNFKVNKQFIPALLNVNERNGRYEGIIVMINTRDEYETQLLASKRNAERIQKETDIANTKLIELLIDVKEKKLELETLNDELQILAAHDELTDLWNRRVFREKLANAIEEAYANENSSFTLAIFDIDHFKKVNDLYGHSLGDKVLVELAKKVQSSIQPPHLISRIGGEEFSIIFYDVDFQEAHKMTEDLREFLSVSEWNSIAVTVSAGITDFKKGDTSNTIFTRADDALYASKRKGRNRLTSR
ncbi:sensor domain-containing diguanylate cyclase [Sporosarcina sp. CAU 1771]